MANPRKEKALLKKINSHGNGVYTLTFEIDKKYTRFKPGQFLHLTLDSFDPTTGFWPESRVFSIASIPKTNFLQIVYSVKGYYTSRMEKELKAGESYWLKLPYGDFIIERNADVDDSFILIAGGTGISPYIPYLLDSNKQFPDKKVSLYYGVKEKANFLYLDEILKASKDMSNLSISLFQENGSADENVNPGRLDIQNIIQENEDLSAKYFLSGPPDMIKNFKRTLIDNNIEEKKIIVDEWV